MRDVVWFALGFVLFACHPDGGQASVAASFPSGAVIGDDFRAFVSVEGDGRVLSSVGPAPISANGHIEFPALTIPHGDKRRVRIEVFAGMTPEPPARFHGVSPSFDFNPGDTIMIVVDLVASPSKGVVRILGTTGGSIGRALVDLEITTDAVSTVELLNLADFDDAARQTFDLRMMTPTQLGEGTATYVVPWDLDAGLEPTCAGRQYCPRQVAARLYDADGYWQSVTSSVVVDTLPPAVVADTVFIGLAPPPNSLRTSVEDVTNGTQIAVRVAFDEPIDGAPLVWLDGPTRIEFDGCTGSGDFHPCTLDVRNLPPLETEWMVRVDAVDRVGHRHSGALLGTVVVDTIAPASPPGVVGGGIVYDRRPRGTAVDATPVHVVGGKPGSANPRDAIVALSTAELDGANELGRAPVEADGSFAVPLGLDDRERVYIVVVDQAGNASDADPMVVDDQAALVETVEWSSPPQRAIQTPRFDASVRPPDWIASPVPNDELELLARTDNNVLRVETAALWEDRTPDGILPPAREAPGLTYDAARGLTVMFGGSNARGYLAGTWVWNGYRWSLESATSPPARSAPILEFDAQRGNVLLFGGLGNGPPQADTWTLDAEGWHLRTPVLQPSARWSSAAAYDAAKGLVVVFGGRTMDTNGSRALGDTWIWNGADWMPAASGPSARANHAMAYDPNCECVVLFGGEDLDGGFSDTWIFDGSIWRLAQAGPSPGPRYDHKLVYDEAARRMTLIGGRSGLLSTTVFPSAVWAFDATAEEWSIVESDAGPVLGLRANHGGVYDRGRAQLIVFGGVLDSGAVVDDTVMFQNDGWRDVSPTADNPPPRLRPGFGFDPVSETFLRYGGSFGPEGPPRFETWLFDGWRWTEHVTGPRPQVAAPHLVRSPNGGSIDLIGTSTTSDRALAVWRWSSNGWQRVASSNAAPLGANGMSVAYAPGESAVVFYGGERAGVSSPLWATELWTDGRWGAPALGPAPGRYGASMATDWSTGGVLLFGGRQFTQTGLVESWQFDTTGWTRLRPINEPSERAFAQMASDPQRDEIILHGGRSTMSDTSRDDLWAWSGERQEWRSVSYGPIRAPSRDEGAMEFHSTDGYAVMVAGRSDATTLIDTGVVHRGATDRSALIAVFELPMGTTIDDTRLEVVSGGTGSRPSGASVGGAVPGVVLLGWHAQSGAWRELMRGSADVKLPERLLVQDIEADWVEGGARDSKLSFAVTSSASLGNGAHESAVSVDQMSIRIRYRVGSRSDTAP